jgi:hypothetical protein
MDYRESLATCRQHLEAAGLFVKPSVRDRIMFAHYAGTPGEAVNIEYGMGRGMAPFSGTIVVGRRNGRIRRSIYRQKSNGEFNWPGIVARVKEVLDAIRARKHAEQEAAIDAQIADDLQAMVLAQLEAAPYADPRVQVLDERVYITVAVDKGAAVDIAARLAAIIRGEK